ncbi:SixA phosphatase family protein [Aestuariibaculum sediminum]|uniref:Histidine phosphatase family protein n=1 Tax=Aestuariibaculum sediminum TaxID=2770637 RepID=A0A8J6QCT0_9FLAO|nr:histidine phosphatase family protein [Aestuariibaculum sediminum]MBD0833706.1 histidine phosphatase family protein [Aestuariibaculum sediminum]
MRKLILIRHAKSSWEYDVIDHDRPLKSVGIQDARILSKKLKNTVKSVDLILCSSAERTKLTAGFFISEMEFQNVKTTYLYDLYDFDGRDLIQTIKECEDNVNTLMVFGHNHAVTHFVNTYGSTFIDNVPTCGIVIINFEIDSWKNLNKGETILTLFPRDLKND